jgi:hypothetical protein
LLVPAGVSTDKDSQCSIKGDRPVKFLSPFIAGKGDKTPGLHIGSAGCKPAGLKDQIEIFIVDVLISERPTAPPVEDDRYQFISFLFIRYMWLLGKNSEKALKLF